MKEPCVDNEWVMAQDDFGKVGWSDWGSLEYTLEVAYTLFCR